MQAETPRRWLLVLLVYAILAVVVLDPVASQFSTHYLGSSSDDLHDEVFLQSSVMESLLTGNSILVSRNLEFPIAQNLVYSHKSYLHVLFSVPLMLALPWPQWWNCSILLAVVCSALAAAWAVGRISGDWKLGFLAGIPFLQMPWILAMVDRGHLPQLWSAPLFLAAEALDSTVRRPEDRYAPLRLAAFTIVTSLVYWIWGFLLALLGALLLIVEWPRLDETRWRRILVAAALVLVVVGPIGLYVVRQDPFLPSLTRGGGLGPEAQQAALERATSNAVGSPAGVGTLSTAWAAWLLPGVAVAFAILLALGWWRGWPALFWILAGGFFLVLGLGPRLSWEGRILADAQGHPVATPFYLLMEETGLGYAWRTPDTAVPLIVFCFCAGAALLTREARRGRARGSAAVAVGAWLAVGWVAFVACAGAPRPVVMQPAWIPGFTRALRAMPPGAVLELPMGYACNAWHLQHLHGHPSTHGKRPVPNLVRSNEFALFLYRLNPTLGAGLDLRTGLPNECSEMPYGLRQLPPRIGAPDPSLRVPDGPLSDRRLWTGYAKAYGMGIRYLVLHRASCFWLSPRQGGEVYRRYRRWLVAVFGEPLFEDGEAAVFAMRAPEAMPEGWTRVR